MPKRPRRIPIGARLPLLLMLTLVTTAPAHALDASSLGALVGLSVNPDQVHGGLFADFGEPIDGVRLRPSAVLGVGNGVAIFAANADALVSLGRGRWRPYAGGGLGLNVIDVRDGVGEGRGVELEPVLNVVGGVAWGGSDPGILSRYLAEARIGLGDTPELMVSFGIRF